MHACCGVSTAGCPSAVPGADGVARAECSALPFSWKGVACLLLWLLSLLISGSAGCSSACSPITCKQGAVTKPSSATSLVLAWRRATAGNYTDTFNITGCLDKLQIIASNARYCHAHGHSAHSQSLSHYRAAARTLEDLLHILSTSPSAQRGRGTTSLLVSRMSDLSQCQLLPAAKHRYPGC